MVDTSEWKQVLIARKTKYLGIVLGSGATPKDSYAGPIKKLSKRIDAWKSINISLSIALRV
jgi:hypothetical protein